MMADIIPIRGDSVQNKDGSIMLCIKGKPYLFEKVRCMPALSGMGVVGKSMIKLIDKPV